MAESAVAAAMATAASNNSNNQEGDFSSTTALIAFLRMEADAAEQKSKRFREQAAALARQFGVSEAAQVAYGM
jgi:hypothetical protein